MSKEKPWIPDEKTTEAARKEWRKFIFSKDAEIFGTPACAGYWMYGVEFHRQRGWLVYEFGEDESQDYDGMDHSPAIKAWKAGQKLPPYYFAIDLHFADKSFDNGVKKWGLEWRDNPHHDLGEVDLVLQWTMLGEIKYG